MAVNKTEKIASVNDDAAVKSAQKILMDVEAKFQKAANYPLVDDIAERARAMLDGTKLQPRKEPDQVQVLREAVTLASHRLQAAQQKAAERIIAEIKPLHNEAIKRLLDAAEKFSTELLSQAEFVESCWHSGLYDYLDAHWSLKWRILGGKPGMGSRLDELISNLRLPAY
jgi:hypothetical protein